MRQHHTAGCNYIIPTILIEPSAATRLCRFEREKWLGAVGEAVVYSGVFVEAPVSESGRVSYFTSVVFFTCEPDLFRMKLWDGALIRNDREYVVVGILGEDALGPMVHVLGLFDRSALDFGPWSCSRL